MLWASSPARSDHHHEPRLEPIRTWNELALDTVRVKRLSDAQAARLYAMVNVAIYDAVNGILSSHGGRKRCREHALVPYSGKHARGDIYAAASAAAHAVLAGEFPDQAARYDLQLQSDLASSHGNVPDGQEWGAEVGAQVRAARANDGSTPNQDQEPGRWPEAVPSPLVRSAVPKPPALRHLRLFHLHRRGGRPHSAAWTTLEHSPRSR